MINLEQCLMTCLLLLFLFQSCISIDTITFNQSISDGDVLISNGKNFALGFFSPGSSSNRYLGIWYYKISEQTVVWVANRDNPINNTAGILSITKHGSLLLYSQDIVFWSSNVSNSSMNNCVAQLLDTGNLVLVQSNTNRVIWQSFDYPTDTQLPNMKLGLNRKTGFNWFLTSWKSPDDPGTGDFSYRFEMNGYPQLVLYEGPGRRWRTGPWRGHRWTGAPEMVQNLFFDFSFVDNGDELYSTYSLLNATFFSRKVLNESGSIQQLSWYEGEKRWFEVFLTPKERCDNYGQCGANRNCNPYTVKVFKCTCLPGYEPKSPHNWYLRNGSEGCVRKRMPAAATCGKGDGFVKVEFTKVPDTWKARVNTSMSLKACEEECLRNCTCRAYASADIRGGENGCASWHGDLMDTRVYSDGGQDLFIRVDAIELAQYAKKSKSKKGMVAILAVCAAVMLLLLVSLLYWFVSRKRAEQGQPSSSCFEDSPRANELADGRRTNSDLKFFDLSTIAAATDKFSPAKKLGQGGFGAVYKGQLLNGQEIAVKRLSKSSGQGIEEFKNEVTLIAKLQHRNLVRLLGYCIKKEEKMLIYEYLPNKSLDSFIFDETRRSLLDWRKRFEIICGIARGILYLHQDSRLRIIHRDLKASNVLLDVELNPKISDFGLARMFGGDQIEGNTNRVVGTYGYMSPEYAMEGLFSIKSDVFSFGILLIEIITGRKNSGFYHESSSANLIEHVWDLWKEGTWLEMVDSSLGDSYPANEVLRIIQIGLLCVQDSAMDRPTMLEVVSMLGNDTNLPSPKKPAFIVRKGYYNVDPSTANEGTNASVNEVTITLLEGR